MCYAKKQHLTHITQSLSRTKKSQDWNTHYKSALTEDKCYLYLGTQVWSILQQGLVQTSAGLYLWSGKKTFRFQGMDIVG